MAWNWFEPDLSVPSLRPFVRSLTHFQASGKANDLIAQYQAVLVFELKLSIISPRMSRGRRRRWSRGKQNLFRKFLPVCYLTKDRMSQIPFLSNPSWCPAMLPQLQIWKKCNQGWKDGHWPSFGCNSTMVPAYLYSVCTVRIVCRARGTFCSFLPVLIGSKRRSK